tara:strand:- start:2536 stop:2922 length:387 start_codon:yes stop_codon:yes gene_type:complete
MARTLTLNATYALGDGDNASSESQGGIFTAASGLSTVINGSAPTGGIEYVVASYLGASNKAKGVYVENTDATNYVVVKLGTGSGGGQVASIRLKAGSMLMLHDDADAITHIGLTANTAAVSFVLGFCE